MPGKDRQRQLAREKVQRQMARRAAQARRRRRLQAIAGSVAAVIAIVALAGFGASKLGGDEKKKKAPAAKPAADSCSYDKPKEGQRGPVPRKVAAPQVKDVVKTGAVRVALKTNRGELALTLDRAKAPCTVHNFVSLAQQKYFDKTPCHRLTTKDFYVLQCGDPGGTGGGGPGYVFADEGLPAKQGAPVPYPAGTVAMANGGPGTNGSQFFIVYSDTEFPPSYTVFGTVAKGLAVVETIAKAGSTPPGDGKPNNAVTIQSVRLGS